jgi:hypothetical protein
VTRPVCLAVEFGGLRASPAGLGDVIKIELDIQLLVPDAAVS